MAATTETTNRAIAFAAFIAQETTPETLGDGELMTVAYDAEAGTVSISAIIKVEATYDATTNSLELSPIPVV